MSSSNGPSSEQISMMSSSWSATDITASNTAGVIGMYTKNDLYTFYMFFRANDVDEWWKIDTSTTYGGCCVSEDSTVTY